MATILNTIFRLKRGTASRWAELNLVLQEGEPGFVLDENRLKIGDGKTPWNELPFLDNEVFNEIIAIKEFISQAEDIDSNHEARISKMETFWTAADDPEETIDKLAEIVNYINADKSGALTMAAQIQKNSESLAAIYNINTKTGILTNEISRVENLVQETGNSILTQAKNYADQKLTEVPGATAEVLGLVKYDGYTINKNQNNQLYIAKVSTDVLEQGSDTLVLSSGNANI